ncbi:MAG: hypothetical protein R3327_07800 [Nitrosopumilaceae archaeon]|nr:hypothetical protein [Nitrosopumilaceae archaeon]
MNTVNNSGMIQLAASCPQCQANSLYCGKIETDVKSLQNREMLFCRSCKFVIPVEEFKDLLCSP